MDKKENKAEDEDFHLGNESEAAVTAMKWAGGVHSQVLLRAWEYVLWDKERMAKWRMLDEPFTWEFEKLYTDQVDIGYLHYFDEVN